MTTATIADELTCPVCLEFYKDPRVLPCQHSLCKSCLVALLYKKEEDSDCDLQCPSCRYLFQAKNETHIEYLPKNFTLASIVCKFQESVKGTKFFPCDVCEEGQKGRAIKKCLQCKLHYCRICLEQLHPKRGALANHELLHIMDTHIEKDEHKEPRSALSSSVSENEFVATHKYDQLMRVRYCMSCDAMFSKGDQISAVGGHEHHDTTEMQTAFRTKREEFERTLARLLDEGQELDKELANKSNLIKTIQSIAIDKKIELVQRFVEVAEEVQKNKMSAETRIDEEMKMRITSLECRLRELEDLKAKTQIKIDAFSQLSSLTNEDAGIFLIKLKELQNEIEPVTGEYIKHAEKETDFESLLPIEQSMNEIIANALRDICTSERRHQVPDPNKAHTDVSPEHVNVKLKVTNVQNEGEMSAEVEWVAIHLVDHYDISYFCNPEETVLRRNIVENRCRLTNLKWDSEYTITMTAYLPDGKSSYDSTVFKTNPKVKDTRAAIMGISQKRVKMAITVTNVQKAMTMSADVNWSSKHPHAQYDVSYFCNPFETIVLKKMAADRCRLTNLRWDSTYTIKVTTQLQDGTTVFDKKRFKTDPQVVCFPMATSDICNDKIEAPSSYGEFTASNRTKGVVFSKIGLFSGIVFTPILTEDKRFWTGNFDLTIFRTGKNRDLYLDFGIAAYSKLRYAFGLTGNKTARACAIEQVNQRNIHLQFLNGSVQERPSVPLNVQLQQECRFQLGFYYDKTEGVFAVLDLRNRNVLHRFDGIKFHDNQDPVFAVTPYHTFQRMHVNGTLRYEDCTDEDLSYWMLKIKEYSSFSEIVFQNDYFGLLQ